MKKLLTIFLCIVLMLSIFTFMTGCDSNDTPSGPNLEQGGDDEDEDNEGEIDTSRFDTPEAGFTIDGEIDATESAKYNTLSQRYGVEGQMTFSYYIGDKGLYFHFNVDDTIVFKGNPDEFKEGSRDYVMESDRIELFIDTKNDKGISAKSDDFHILVTLEGYYSIERGNGTKFNEDSTIGLDAVATYLDEEATIVSTRDANAEENPRSTEEPDEGYQVEFFVSYQNFEFSKRSDYGISVAQTDEWNVVQEGRFNVAGSNVSPSEFRSLSVHGLGTTVALEQGIVIDGVKDSFFTAANAASNEFLHRFEATRAWGQLSTRGNMTVETYVYLGNNGLYISMNASSEFLKYYYQDFPYFSDHVELRIDTNNSRSADSGDRWFFQDIMGAQQTAYGIDNANRVIGSYDLIAATAYTGEVVDNANRPVKNSGSTDPKTFTFEAFFPYYALGIQKGATFTMTLCCGNPNEGASGIGNVFYAGTSYTADKDAWHSFEKYNKYTEFTLPA